MSDPDDLDLLAAEYVLGTLDGAERSRVAARLVADPGLAEAVTAWQHRLSPLSEATREIAPPATILSSILARLFGQRAEGSPAVVLALRRSVVRWKVATAGLAALAAGLVGWVLLPHAGGVPPQPAHFATILQRDAGAPAMVVDVDLSTRRLTIHPLATASPTGKSFQLWLIDTALGPPRSLGLVPASPGTEASLAAFDPTVITDATYAVTIEPLGGSPSGQPTSAPILIGRLFRTAP